MWGGSCRGGVGWVIQGWDEVGHARVGVWWVGHVGVGWGVSYRGGVGLVM